MDWKKDILTIPNLLSLFRLLLIPVYVVIYLNAGEDLTQYYIAAGILAVSCLTDLIDGRIARRFNMSSRTGQALDPFADKATQLALIICLSIKYPVLLIMIGLFVIKELYQLIQAAVSLRKGQMLAGALMSGKICTTVLFVSLIFMVMVPNLNDIVIYIITAVDCLFLIISFIAYIRVYYTDNPMLTTVEELNKRSQNNSK